VVQGCEDGGHWTTGTAVRRFPVGGARWGKVVRDELVSELLETREGGVWFGGGG